LFLLYVWFGTLHATDECLLKVTDAQESMSDMRTKLVRHTRPLAAHHSLLDRSSTIASIFSW